MDIRIPPPSATLPEKRDIVLAQIAALIEGEPSSIANMANIAALLKQTFDFWWVGFYIIDGDALVLGPFQGPVACTRIAMGKGVCGDVWEQGESIFVPNVEEYPGHIACSAESKSEVVCPIYHQGKMVGVLDVDSTWLNDFSADDVTFFEAVTEMLGKQWR